MKAIQYHAYGDRSVLALEEIADPASPRSGQVRVAVIACSVNPVDGKVRRGELKLIAGGRFPKRPGLDFCGEVEALGVGVAGFEIGDLVYGAAPNMSDGAFVEHLLVRAEAIAKKPATLDADTAAGVPTVGIAALQVLRDIIKVQSGDRVLVNGCTGGVGLFALQLAKRAGAMVTGVCGTDGIAQALEMGADKVFDYRKREAPAGDSTYRAVLELSGKLSFDDAQNLLDEGGLYVDFSPSPASLIGNTVANPFRSRKHVFAMTAANTSDLESLARAIDAGELKAAPTRILPLGRFDEGFALVERGGVIGKVVVRMRDVA